MKTHKFLAPLICLCSALLFCVAARAQDTNTYLYLVHAAPGRNISATTNPALPVDISINGQTCAVKGATFGDVVGPIVGPAGSYAIKVTLANTANPCSGTSVFEVSQNLTAATVTFGVLGVNASNQVSGQFFQPDVSAIPAGQSRVVIANVTDVALSAALTGMATSETNSISNIAPNTSQTAVAPSGAYAGGIFLTGTETQVYGPMAVDLFSRNLYFYVLAGWTANNSVQVISKEIKNVL
jgi:Domain of unknown function (DUF4397)